MLIRTHADVDKLEGEDKLSAAERELIQNCKIGEPTVLGDGVRPDGPSAERTIRADLLRYLILGGCEACRVHERGVFLVGAWIRGGLDLDLAVARGMVNLIHCGFGAPIIARQALFDSLSLDSSKLPALCVDGAAIKGNVFLGGLNSTGTVSFFCAEIGGQLIGNGAEMNGGQGKALQAQSATIKGGVFLDKLKATGAVSFAGAEIGGQLSCVGAELNGVGGTALNAEGATVKGGVYLDELKSIGAVRFVGAEVGGQLSCSGAELIDEERTVLDVQAATINGGVFLHKMKSIGEVSFAGAEIGGQLSCLGTELNGGRGAALNGQRLIVKSGLIWRGLTSVIGSVDLSSAHLGDLVDDKKSWDIVSKLYLVGATYENLMGPLDLGFRTTWLRKGAIFANQFHPQPYQQLAKFYGETGHRHDAREILIQKEKEQRKAMRDAIRLGRGGQASAVEPCIQVFLHKFLDEIMRVVAGYGYKPWLSLWWLGGLVAAMTLWSHFVWQAGDFAPNSAVVLTSADWKVFSDGTPERPPSDDPAISWSSGPGRDYETFYSFAYAMDVVVPVLELGQMEAWAPSPARGAWGYWLFYGQKIFVVLGWVVTALAAAAVTGMIRRDD